MQIPVRPPTPNLAVEGEGGGGEETYQAILNIQVQSVPYSLPYERDTILGLKN